VTTLEPFYLVKAYRLISSFFKNIFGFLIFNFVFRFLNKKNVLFYKTILGDPKLGYDIKHQPSVRFFSSTPQEPYINPSETDHQV